MNKRQWMDDYNERNCTCKNASMDNSCKGLITCTLRSNHPERKAMHAEDLKLLWAGRSQAKPHPQSMYYQFQWDLAKGVHTRPHSKLINWTGQL